MRKSNPSPASRLQLDLMPAAKQRLHNLRDETEAASYSEVLKRALQLYEKVHTGQKEGKTFGFLVNEHGQNVFHELLVLT